MTIQWIVPVETTASLTRALHGVIAATRNEPGCIGCSVSTNVADKAAVRYTEEWRSEETLQRQFKTDRFGSLVALIETATEAPTVQFTLPSGDRGFDYVIEVRERHV